MSSTTNETAQQHRERLLLAQAERQRAREEEVARQEAEFATEMERLEEEAAREEEEKRLAEEKRVQEEKRIAEECRVEEQRRQEEEEMIAEERRVVEEQKKQQEKQAEAAAEVEDEQEQTSAFAKIVEENKKEKERAAKELEKRHKQTAKARNVEVEVPTPSSGLRRKTFKSKAIISEDSEDEGEDKRKEPTPRGVKHKRTIRMITKRSNTSNLDREPAGAQPPPDSSLPRPAPHDNKHKHVRSATTSANDAVGPEIMSLGGREVNG
ncbi:hypothetical protein GGU10DRAFT_382372 [Lentinula aff. detonsa]|uniref:Uncharacterized protein n=1 Tax=Lentinula aff. detonsa TaxID=2804958 RepID=A0AA38KCP0_9AGAR|nr:hypothetical protein GGU10DRAFT_382372 [Lentinula aff. detonsa]